LFFSSKTARKTSNTTRKTLKIKKAFPKLQNKKIKKIISSDNTTKPRLNMTTKRLSRKQVIVSMNSENTKKFIKDASSHVANINRVLKNIKLDIAADFIQSDNKGVIITTNKIVSTLNLQIIKIYVKNINIELN